MTYFKGLFLIALIIGCTAVPTPEEDLSIYFEHVDPSARIVGGTEAAVGAHPHMVALTNGLLVRSLLCGGSVIGVRTVLTAAHCIAAVFSWGSLSANLRGTVGTNRWNTGGTLYSFARNVTHENYVSGTIKNDIGLLITSANIAYNAFVSPVPVDYDFVNDGVGVRVAGWGRIRAGGAISAVLLEILNSVIDGQRCIEEVDRMRHENTAFWNAPPVEPHIEICTFHSVGVGTCNGDSGSALVRRDNGQQVGIVSWGFACALGAPDMFVRVSAYREWLASHIV